nr:hypothetical protein [Tanacetum cinerariifolium]
MVVSTRNCLTVPTNSSSLVLDDATKRFFVETIAGMIEDSLALMRRPMKEMSNNISGLSLHNQQMGNRGPQLNHSILAKIEFPKFSGDDVKGWVFRCERFFFIEQTLDLEKVTLISIHLYDKVLLWHSQFVRTHGNNVGWNEYKQAILTRFGKGYDDPMFELKNLKYETTVREYENAFDNILSRVEVSEEHAEDSVEGEFLEVDETFMDTGLIDLQAPLISLNALTGCEMVLGIQWLETLRDIRSNFHDLRMDFKYNCRRILLSEAVSTNVIHPMFQQIISAYEDVFAIPTALPPTREHDHRVPLIERAQPVTIRPYRHPPTQKDAIEGMVG